ncbi:hypothetical protein EHO58_05475 [Leptospira selangorensis]|uniref:hypothetical protein n=1 Tax=Leptospira selangorensis TaxID=2484982 RepID=UPI0010833F87|nr:hypothetical protein [Leptospira selangorensis]TGK08642.1 hypothetical protein EHO58_05475 [Leptospira selangorensis]
MSPDQNEQIVSFDSNKNISYKDLNVLEVFELSDNQLHGYMFLTKANSNFIDALLLNFSVDNQNSAVLHLSQDYLVGLVVIENDTDVNKIFSFNSLKLNWKDTKIVPLLENEYPDKIKCFNWKGTTKNFYNFMAISAITVGVVVYAYVALFACLQGKCERIDDLKNFEKRYSSKLKGPHFSNFNFTSTLSFNDAIKNNGIAIPQNTIAKGIVLYRNPFLIKDINDYTLKGNCTIY